ncbi:uncharacterized protein MICPUCDRAFT_55910 [Micromonas pusilla CCMP1545]|jgi:pimeloyl-ACP methyl ester carboxylesterase|uniref:Predicted protein n=1 Tax=Micromonas pusilla (strain CCMP1545) TaxID=564608 RepID=C1MNI3_MICPC|nr:uncharacterized protein MICPUCDRAFT_55910 [Micromonas pusilla CCMP1545]EEH58754.1 predicted protein [Micromonas pusilla CCMP1545]|eukprot:XP_003057109.1 predicted protein [Micromonas pusilla CCMP1545]
MKLRPIERIGSYGARVHYLANASHWVHIDNPDGLLEILAPSFGAIDRGQGRRVNTM